MAVGRDTIILRPGQRKTSCRCVERSATTHRRWRRWPAMRRRCWCRPALCSSGWGWRKRQRGHMVAWRRIREDVLGPQEIGRGKCKLFFFSHGLLLFSFRVQNHRNLYVMVVGLCTLYRDVIFLAICFRRGDFADFVHFVHILVTFDFDFRISCSEKSLKPGAVEY